MRSAEDWINEWEVDKSKVTKEQIEKHIRILRRIQIDALEHAKGLCSAAVSDDCANFIQQAIDKV